MFIFYLLVSVTFSIPLIAMEQPKYNIAKTKELTELFKEVKSPNLCIHENYQTIVSLLEQRANPNIPLKYKNSLMHCTLGASIEPKDKINLLDKMITCGADIWTINNIGVIPLAYAKSIDIIERLLQEVRQENISDYVNFIVPASVKGHFLRQPPIITMIELTGFQMVDNFTFNKNRLDYLKYFLEKYNPIYNPADAQEKICFAYFPALIKHYTQEDSSKKEKALAEIYKQIRYLMHITNISYINTPLLRARVKKAIIQNKEMEMLEEGNSNFSLESLKENAKFAEEALKTTHKFIALSIYENLADPEEVTLNRLQEKN